MTPRVSIIIPVYNAAETVGQSLSSILSQAGLREKPEIICIDNNSTDTSAEIVRQYPVTLLHEAKPGPSAARNAGLRAARGEIVACIDADAFPTRRWLMEILRPLENPETTMVAGATFTYNPQTAAERYCDASGIFHPRHNIHQKDFPFALGTNMAVRASVARAIGGWDESLRYGEDVDFCYRIHQRHPGTFAYAEKAVLFHRNRPTHRGLARQANSYGRGVAMIYQRFPDAARWSLLRGGIVLANVAGRCMNAAVTATGRPLGLVDRERAALSYCHALWGVSFWRGFFTEYYWLRSQKRL